MTAIPRLRRYAAPLGMTSFGDPNSIQAGTLVRGEISLVISRFLALALPRVVDAVLFIDRMTPSTVSPE